MIFILWVNQTLACGCELVGFSVWTNMA